MNAQDIVAIELTDLISCPDRDDDLFLAYVYPELTANKRKRSVVEHHSEIIVGDAFLVQELNLDVTGLGQPQPPPQPRPQKT